MTTVATVLRSCFIGSCHVGVLKRFSRSISLALSSFAFIHVLSSLIRSNEDPTLAVFIVCGPLELVGEVVGREPWVK